VGKEVSVFVAFFVIAAAVALGWIVGQAVAGKVGLSGA
jgi:hypothetical protein